MVIRAFWNSELRIRDTGLYSRPLTCACKDIPALIVTSIPGMGVGQDSGIQEDRHSWQSQTLHFGCGAGMPAGFGQIQRWILIGLNLE